MIHRTALFVGDVSFDLTMSCTHVPEPDEKVHVDAAIEGPGGVAANAAVACSLAGTPTRLVISVGDDAVGQRLIDQLTSSGLAVCASIKAGPTCRVVVLLEPHGEKRLLLYPGVSMYPMAQQFSDETFSDVGWVHTAVYDVTLAGSIAEQCTARGIPLSLDLEPSTFADGLEKLHRVIAGAAVVFCNERSIACAGEDAVRRILAMGVRTVVETKGSHGAVLHNAGTATRVAAHKTRVVDTTGAGDCLAGWFISGSLRGQAPEQALEAAIAAATISCGRLGAQASFPTFSEMTHVAT